MLKKDWIDTRVEQLKDIFIRNLEYKQYVFNNRKQHAEEEYENDKEYWNIKVVINPDVLDKASLTCNKQWLEDRYVNEGIYSWLVRKVREEVRSYGSLQENSAKPNFKIEKSKTGEYILADVTQRRRHVVQIKYGYCNEMLELCLCIIENNKDFL